MNNKHTKHLLLTKKFSISSGHRDILQGKVSQENGFVVAGGGFLSYWNHQLIKFEEEKRFGL
jgi:hypothetical protein